MSHSERETRQQTHPLLLYDPHILDGGIQLLKLEYLEAETTRAPVPRNQQVPKEAFGTLTGRSILVATSHAWFHQCHPDPHGVKLKMLRQQFFPRLRKRYPYTQILVFDDWHSCPQWPRITKEENDRFKKCMDHMNSIYCYCDVVLFVEARLPTLDETVFTCYLVPSEHKWLHFIDTIQYVGGDDETLTIRKNDIVIGMENCTTTLTVDVLKQTKERAIISFLRRPYGRPNRTPAEKRGWLYAERITVAIRMAAAKPEMFDDVVVSNNFDLVKQIYLWSRCLRDSAVNEEKEPGSIARQLREFQDVLVTMKFTFPGNDILVDEIIKDLVAKFEMNWNEEMRRQSDMAVRAREILLRWGCFSEDYVERAGSLESGDRTLNWSQTMLRLVCIGMVAPLLAILPFAFEVTTDPSEDEFIRSFWFGCVTAVVPVLFGAPSRNECAQIPYGKHNVLNLLSLTVDHALVSCTFMCLNVSLLLVSNSYIIVQFSFEPYLEFQLFPWSTFV